MKKLFSILALFAISGIVISQTPTVTINTTGNRNKQIAVDSKYYTISNTTSTDQQAVVLNDLAVGQHTLNLVRRNQYNKNISTKTTFSLRDGYDLTININANGSISTSEKRIARVENNTDKAISTAIFNNLYKQTSVKTSSTARAAFLETEFSSSNKYFTSTQVNKLIMLVNSESLRLKLAKLSYTKVTDQQNFSVVINLLKSLANRNELNNYIAALPDSEMDEDVNTAYNPLSDEKFSIIYNEVKAESSQNDKNIYLSNFFNKDYNYYTSSQAKQFIQLVIGEQERLSMVKAAYRGITDRENYGMVSQLLNSSGSRSELASYITTFESNVVRDAMSTTDFNQLYQSVYYTNNSTSRFNSINTAFSTPGNYFTVEQAKKIIPLVYDENSRLLLAKAAYNILVDRTNYLQFNDFLSSYSSRTALQDYVTRFDNGILAGVAMNDADYNKLYNNINSAWNASARVNLAAEAFNSNTNYFTVYQASRILALIIDENEKLILAKNAYDNIVDQANYSQLYNLFNSTTSKNELASFVTGIQNGIGTVAKVPMTDAEYNKIARDIQFTFGFGAKMSSLTDLFNKDTNYFTVLQAKELIQMVSLESNRLELAKSAYNNITDPENFSQVYDIFTSQSAKNELTAYVNSNAYINK